MQERSIPLFAVFLSTLMHNYFLALVDPSFAPRPAAHESPSAMSPVHDRASIRSARPVGMPHRVGVACRRALSFAAAKLYQFALLVRSCGGRESHAPHCLLLHLKVCARPTLVTFLSCPQCVCEPPVSLPHSLLLHSKVRAPCPCYLCRQSV